MPQDLHLWELDISAYAINGPRILDIIGSSMAEPIVRRIHEMPGGQWESAFEAVAIKDALLAWLRQNPLRPFEADLEQGRISPGSVYSVTGNFYCRGLAGIPLFDYEAAKECIIHRKVGEANSTRLEITFDPKGVKTNTGWVMLMGRHYLTCVFRVLEVSAKQIQGRALLIGQTIGSDTGSVLSGYPVLSQGEIGFQQIQEFSEAAKEPIPKDIDVLRTIPESEIKKAFAELIGVKIVPKDGGAERSDLQGSVTVGPRRIRTAFVLKGPAGGRRFRPLESSMLGVGGSNQIERLYTEPADLLILQHCHDIPSSFVNMMRAFASQIHRPRLCSIITGWDTLRILRAYRKCGQEPSPIPRRRHRE